MRRILSIGIAAAMLLPSASALAATPKEPDAIFSYGLKGSTITAQLYDHVKRKQLKTLTLDTGLPLFLGSVADANDFVQYDAAGDAVVFVVSNESGYDGSRIDETLPYTYALLRADWKKKTMKQVFTSDRASPYHWIVHPTKSVAYVVESNGSYETGYTSRILQIDLKKGSSRPLATLPQGVAPRELTFSGDMSSLHLSAERQLPSGMHEDVIAAVRLKDGKVTLTPSNVPPISDSGWAESIGSGNISPDGKRVAYHFGVVDAKTGLKTPAIEGPSYSIHNFYTFWSGDGKKVAYIATLAGETSAVPSRLLTLDAAEQRLLEHKTRGLFIRQWAPSSKYMLYLNGQSVGFYDTKTGKSRLIFTGTNDYTTETAWVFLP